MLDIQYIRDNKALVEKACVEKNLNPSVVLTLLNCDDRRRELIGKVENLRAKRNLLNEKLKNERTDALITESRQLKSELEKVEPDLKIETTAFQELMLQIPNVPLEEVPVGKDSSGNIVVREWGTKPNFGFEPKDHIYLAKKNGWLDLERGSKVAGFRGATNRNFRGEAVKKSNRGPKRVFFGPPGWVFDRKTGVLVGSI